MAAASRSMAISRLMVFAVSGRFRVTSATEPRVSTWTLDADIGLPLRLLVRRDGDSQTGEFGCEFDLARQAGICLVVGQLGEQLALIRHGCRQPALPLGIDINVTGRARAHAAANCGNAVIELTQGLHDLQAGLRIDLVLDSVAIDDTQKRHELTSVI